MKKLFVLASLSAFILWTGCTKSNITQSGLNKKDFQTEIDGKKNDLYVLTNKNGMEVCMTNFGARIVSIWVPDKDGKFGDVVLGFDSIGGYLNNKTDFGAYIGRYGNRINKGQFTLDGVPYQLSTNNFGHSLHGGVKGFQYGMFDIKQLSDTSLEVSYVAADGEMGFPGKLTAKAIYTLTSDNAIDIAYEATTDKPTIVNLTNHSYFNLGGHPEKDVLGQMLTIDADGFTPVDTTFMTTGEITPVCCTPMDFRKPTKIGERINNYDFVQLKNGNGYDHNWVLNTKGNDKVPACCLMDSVSGRTLQVFTNEPGIQVYTGNFLDGTVTGKKGIVYKQRVGICLETQHYPDSPNKANWPSVVLRPGETYHSHCIFKFGVMKDKCCKEKK
jgi:aldose 1-epimerase